MKDDGRAVEHDEPKDQIPERMEERQNAEHSILLVQGEHLDGSAHSRRC